MNDLKKLLPDTKHLSAVDLRKLSADERSAILEAQAALAADLHRPDRQLTDFEAFGEEELHGNGVCTDVVLQGGCMGVVPKFVIVSGSPRKSESAVSDGLPKFMGVVVPKQ